MLRMCIIASKLIPKREGVSEEEKKKNTRQRTILQKRQADA